MAFSLLLSSIWAFGYQCACIEHGIPAWSDHLWIGLGPYAVTAVFVCCVMSTLRGHAIGLVGKLCRFVLVLVAFVVCDRCVDHMWTVSSCCFLLSYSVLLYLGVSILRLVDRRLRYYWTLRYYRFWIGVGLFAVLLGGYLCSPLRYWQIFLFGTLYFLLGTILFTVHNRLQNWCWRVLGFGCLFVAMGLFVYGQKSGMSSPLPLRLTICLNEILSFVFPLSGQFALATHGILFYLLKAIVVLGVVALTFSFLGRASLNQIRRLLAYVADENEMYVFWGLSSVDELLARDILKTRPCAKIQINLSKEEYFESATRNRLTSLADSLGAFWTFVDLNNLGETCHWGHRHFFLGTEGHANLALADRLVEAVRKDDLAYSEIELYLRAGDYDHMDIYSSWAKRAYENTGHLVHPHVLLEPEMIARNFLFKYPTLRAPGFLIDTQRARIKSGTCHTLLLGFDHTGRALLNALLCQSSFVGEDGKKVVAFPVTVVDMKRDRWERYGCMLPEIGDHAEEYGLSFECMQVGFQAFERWFEKNHACFNRIIFCLKGDNDNIREALRLRERLILFNDTKDKEILVRVSDPSINRFAQMEEQVLPLSYFGNLADLYSAEFVLDEPIDNVARQINWQWCVNRSIDAGLMGHALVHEAGRDLIQAQLDDVNRFWEEASYANRLSSRASAAGAFTFFLLLGLTCRPKNEKLKSTERKVPLDEVNARVARAKDELARVEHLRWRTYQRSIGVREWDLQSPCSLDDVLRERGEAWVARNPANALANQKKICAHAAMVDFDELPLLDLKFARAVQQFLKKDLRKSVQFSLDQFIGNRRPAIGRKGTASACLQCKDYDCWSVVPEAISLAGYEFIESRETCSAKEQEEISGDSVCRIGLWARLKKIKRWLMKKSSVVPQDFDDLLKQMDGTQIGNYVRWTKDAYHEDTASFRPGDGRDAEPSFLDSSIVCRRHDLTFGEGKGTVFWFKDSISPLFLFKELLPIWLRPEGKRRLHKNRFPLFYNAKTGRIQPFKSLENDVRCQFLKEEGDMDRRVDYQSQPDFVAQVFSWNRKTVVVFGGTATIADWVEDYQQFRGETPPQFRLAADLVRAVCETTPNEEIVLLGHSEGGGEVQYALVKNNLVYLRGTHRLSGVTFNAQRLSDRTLTELRKIVQTDLRDAFGESLPRHDADEKVSIVNIRTEWDAVSGWAPLGLDLLGSVYKLNGPEQKKWGKYLMRLGAMIVWLIRAVWIFKSHRINNVVTAIEKRVVG